MSEPSKSPSEQSDAKKRKYQQEERAVRTRMVDAELP